MHIHFLEEDIQSKYNRRWSSIKTKAPLKCGACGFLYEHTFYSGIGIWSDQEESRQLVKKLLEGSLFKYKCPRCNNIGEISYKLIIAYYDGKILLSTDEKPEKIKEILVKLNLIDDNGNIINNPPREFLRGFAQLILNNPSLPICRTLGLHTQEEMYEFIRYLDKNFTTIQDVKDFTLLPHYGSRIEELPPILRKWFTRNKSSTEPIKIENLTRKSKEFLFRAGNSKIKDEKYDQAIQFFNKAIKEDPNNNIFWNNLGVAYNRLGNTQKAIECFDKAIQINPEDIYAWMNKGTVYSYLGEQRKATYCLNKADKINPKLVTPIMRRGIDYKGIFYENWAIKKKDSLTESIKKEIITSESNEFLFRAGNLQIKGENYDKAIQLFNKAIKEDPNNNIFWNNLGVAYNRLGNTQKAIECFDKAIQINPEDVYAWQNKGYVNAILGNNQKAADCLEKAIDIFPKLYYLKMKDLKGLYYEELNEKRELKRIENTIEEGDDNWSDKNIVVVNPDKTIEILELDNHERNNIDKVLDEQSEIFWTQKGIENEQMGKYQDAIKCFEKAITINPESFENWSNLGVAYKNKGNYKKAFTYFKKAIEIDAKVDNTWYNLGIVWFNFNNNDLKTATRCYLKALDLNPNNQKAKNALIKLKKIKPNEIEIVIEENSWIRKGIENKKVGKFHEAIECFERALNFDPQNVVSWYNLGDIYENLGNKIKLLENYNKCKLLNEKYPNEINAMLAMESLKIEPKVQPKETIIKKPKKSKTKRVTCSITKKFSFTHDDVVRTIAVSPCGNYVFTGSKDKKIKMVNLESQNHIRTFEGHNGMVLSIAISPNGKYIASGSSDKTIKIWEVETGKLIRTLEGHRIHVFSVKFSLDEKYIYSGSWDKTIKIWDFSNGELLHSLGWHKDCVYSLAISADGKYLASGSWDGKINVWDINSWKILKTIENPNSQIYSVVISKDGKYIVSGSSDKEIKLWKIRTGELVRNFAGHEKTVNSVCLSNDQKLIVSGSDDKKIKFWDLNDGRTIKTISTHDGIIYSVKLTPDDKTLITGSADKKVIIWDVIKDLI